MKSESETPWQPDDSLGPYPMEVSDPSPAPDVMNAGEDGPSLAEVPVLPVRATVLFPVKDVMSPLLVSREISIAAVEAAMASDRRILVLAQREQEKEEITSEDLFLVGTQAVVGRMLKLPDGTTSVLVEGQRRVRVVEFCQLKPHIRARTRAIEDAPDSKPALEALSRDVLRLFEKVVRLSRNLPQEVYVRAMNADGPSALADIVASSIDIPFLRLQELLELDQASERLSRVFRILSHEIQIIESEQKIGDEINTQVEKAQHAYVLREQMRAITKEIGESDLATRDLQELGEKLGKGTYPEHVKERVNKELDRLNSMPPGSPEVNVIRNYVEWLLDLPWSQQTRDRLDIDFASEVLDRNHHGLKTVKERILEYLSVRKLARRMRSPILCFVGPPGVGKTSLGRSIAEAMGRKFVRVSLGGVRDEAEIRGHRRTYVGSMPGRILQTMREARRVNPVFMLDEIDKLGIDFRGDPTTALLEVLDPEQNHAFSDHYVEIPYNLSRVLFIAAANTLYSLPPALIDRMEIIELPGYIEDEKIAIANDFLVPEQIKEHGLEPRHLTFSRAALGRIIREYTREAGVRALEREIATICRRRAYRLAEGDTSTVRASKGTVPKHLGPPRYKFGAVAEKDEVATAMGVFRTPSGGELMPVEVSVSDGSGKLTITGQLGEVMQESVKAAQTYSRSYAAELGIGQQEFDQVDIHVHIHYGGTPKEGASAGVTIAAALVSALSGRAVRRDTTMTGEITIRGRVLRTEGLKEKILAAHRAGLKQFIMPKANEHELDDVPESAKRDLEFIFATSMGDVVRAALVSQPQ